MARQVVGERATEIISAPDLPFIVRPMREADIPAVMAIERCSFPSPWPESAYRYELRFGANVLFCVLQLRQEPDVPTWSAWLRGALSRRRQVAVVGYAGLRFRSESAHVSTIAVHPDWRRQGLGTWLLLTMIEQAISRGMRRVTLEVRPSNKIAQQLYARVGFVRTSVRHAYYRDGEDAWLMALGPLNEGDIGRLWELKQVAERHLAQRLPQA